MSRNRNTNYLWSSRPSTILFCFLCVLTVISQTTILTSVCCHWQFTALIEGAPGPIVYTKDIYIGTVPMCKREMRSCIAGMYNQPYTESVENLTHFSGVSASQVSQSAATRGSNHEVAPECCIEQACDPNATVSSNKCIKPVIVR